MISQFFFPKGSYDVECRQRLGRKESSSSAASSSAASAAKASSFHQPYTGNHQTPEEMFHDFMQSPKRKNSQQREFYDFFRDDFSDSFEDFEIIIEQRSDFSFRPFSNRATSRRRNSHWQRGKVPLHNMKAKQTTKAKKKEKGDKHNYKQKPQQEAAQRPRSNSMKDLHFLRHGPYSQVQDEDDCFLENRKKNWPRATQWSSAPPQKKKDASAYYSSAFPTKKLENVRGKAAKSGSNYDGSLWSKSLRAQSVNSTPHAARRPKRKRKDTEKDGLVW